MEKQIIPISKDILEPIIKTNVEYVENLEEFEKIELEPNQVVLKFDNNKPCFYIKERDKFGEYSVVRIYFYENFAQKVKNLEKEEFIKKCHKAGFDELKTEIACMFFLENKKPQDVWLWLIGTKKKDIEWDSVKTMRCRLKKRLSRYVTD